MIIALFVYLLKILVGLPYFYLVINLIIDLFINKIILMEKNIIVSLFKLFL